MKNGDYELIIAPSEYPGKLYRGKYCSKHVYEYWRAYGVIPNDDEIIHHKDGNKHNNDPSNLQLMKRKDHIKLHSEHLRRLLLLKCPCCGKLFIRPVNQCYNKKIKNFYCSRSCSVKMERLDKLNKKNIDIQERKRHNIVLDFYGNIDEFNYINDEYNN